MIVNLFSSDHPLNVPHLLHIVAEPSCQECFISLKCLTVQDMEHISLPQCPVHLKPLTVKDIQQHSLPPDVQFIWSLTKCQIKRYVKTKRPVQVSQNMKKKIKAKVVSTKNKGSVTFKCNFCSRVYSTENGWYKHVWTHYEGRHQCATCGKCFQYPHILQNHEELHKKKLPIKGKFPGCIKRYAMSAVLTNHKLTHCRKKVKCSVCNFTTSTRQYLKKHMTGTHGQGLKSRCGVIFSWPHQHQEHQYWCKKCKKISKKHKVSI